MSLNDYIITLLRLTLFARVAKRLGRIDLYALACSTIVWMGTEFGSLREVLRGLHG